MSDHNTMWQDMLDEMQHDKESSAANKKYWQPASDKEGTFPIRILPPIKDKNEKKFYFAHKIHWVDRVPFECLNQDLVDKNGVEHKASACPVCDYVRKLYKTSERGTDGWKLAGELRAKVRYDYRIIVRATPENPSDETKPVFFETGNTIFDMLYHIMKETDYGIIVDPKDGRDFNLVKRGTKRNSKYDQSLPSANKSPIFTDVAKLKAMMENAKKLEYSSLIEFSSASDMENALRTFIGGGSDVPVKKRAEEPAPDAEFRKEAPVADEPSAGDEDAIDEILKEFNT